MNHGVDACHGSAHGVTIDERCDVGRKLTGGHVESDNVVASLAQCADERLPEMAGTTGD
jgi:hypothetical protein